MSFELVSFELWIAIASSQMLQSARITYQPGTVEASSHLSDVGLTAKPAGQRCNLG